MRLRVLHIAIIFTSYSYGVNAEDILNFKDLSGEVGYQYRDVKVENSSSTSQNIRATLRTNGYIWQPWFVTLNAGGTMAFGESDSGGSSRSQQMYAGDININALPLSRFPLNINFARSDNFIENSPSTVAALSSGTTKLDQHQTTTSYGFLQQYKGRRSQSELSYKEHKSTIDDSDSESSSYGMTHRYSNLHNSIVLKAQSTEAESDSGVSTKGDSGVVTHSYSKSSRLKINTELSVSDSMYKSSNVLTGDDYSADTKTSQFSSGLNYNSENRKFNSYINLRHIEIEQEGLNNNVSIDTKSVTSYFGINNSYRFNQYIHTGFGGDVTRQESNNTKSRQSAGRASIATNTPNYELIGHNYSANSTIGTSYTRSDEDAGRQDSASLSHGANKNIQIGRGTAFRYAVGQSYSYAISSDGNEPDERISHNLNGRLTHSRKYSRFTVITDYNQSSQMNNSDYSKTFDMTGKYEQRIGSRASFDMDAKYRVFESFYGNNKSEYDSQSIKANYTYRRAFGFSTMIFRTMASHTKSDAVDDSNETTYWRNDLEYKVGKLEASLQFQLQDINDETTQLLYLNIKRRL